MTRTDMLLRAQHLREQRTPFVLATVVRAQRPTSAKPGDSALVLPDGTIEGFVGGTCAASTVALQGLRLIDSGTSTLLRITPEAAPSEPAQTDSEGLLTVANPCLSGGTLEIFMEAVLPPALVYVFGDAPVAHALEALGGTLGYHVLGADDPTTPIPPDAQAVVIASHGRYEERILREALDIGVPYLAMVASRTRAAAVLDEMGLAPAERERVHAPAGLDIGARGALEIALSIFAELIAERPRDTAAGGLRAGAESGKAVAAPRIDTAIDPVCGMQVAISPDTITHEHAGRVFHFCGPGCRKAFVDAPERYLA